MTPCGVMTHVLRTPALPAYRKVGNWSQEIQLVRVGAGLKPKLAGLDSVSPAFRSVFLQPGSATSVSLSNLVFPVSVHTWLSLLGIP